MPPLPVLCTGGRAANGQKSGARSCAKMVVAATATRGATQGHPALTWRELREEEQDSDAPTEMYS